jgi:hypothetical protein
MQTSYDEPSGPNIADSVAWQDLSSHVPEIEQTHLKHLLKDEKRTDMLTVESEGVYADFSRQRVTSDTLKVRRPGPRCGCDACHACNYAAAHLAGLRTAAALAAFQQHACACQMTSVTTITWHEGHTCGGPCAEADCARGDGEREGQARRDVQRRARQHD